MMVRVVAKQQETQDGGGGGQIAEVAKDTVQH